MTTMALVKRVAAVAVAVLVAAGVVGVPSAAAQPRTGDLATILDGQCPRLLAVVVPGTGEASWVTDPSMDSGMLTQVTVPVATTTDTTEFNRYVVPYAGDFGFQGTPYIESVATGVAGAISVLEEFQQLCGQGQAGLTGPAAETVAPEPGTGRTDDSAWEPVEEPVPASGVTPSWLTAPSEASPVDGEQLSPSWLSAPESSAVPGGAEAELSPSWLSGGDGISAPELGSKAEEVRPASQPRMSGREVSKAAVVGFSQGAQVVREVLAAIAQGDTGVDPDFIAAGALFSDPGRAAGSGFFPGKPASAVSPDPVPGTDGQAVTALRTITLEPAPGAGIAPIGTSDFGALTGRVMSLCIAGDLACSAPDAPISRVVTGVAGRLDLNAQDPVGVAFSVAETLSGMTLRTANTLVADGALDNLVSGKPLGGERTLADYLADQAQVGSEAEHDPFAGLAELGRFGFGAAVTVAQRVLTPEVIAQVAIAGITDPAAALTVLGTHLVSAVAEVFPPEAVLNSLAATVQQEVAQGLTDNGELIRAATDARFHQGIALHGAYPSWPIGEFGQTSTQWVADWLRAIISDLTPGSVVTEIDAARSLAAQQ